MGYVRLQHDVNSLLTCLNRISKLTSACVLNDRLVAGSRHLRILSMVLPTRKKTSDLYYIMWLCLNLLARRKEINLLNRQQCFPLRKICYPICFWMPTFLLWNGPCPLHVMAHCLLQSSHFQLTTGLFYHLTPPSYFEDGGLPWCNLVKVWTDIRGVPLPATWAGFGSSSLPALWGYCYSSPAFKLW